MDYWLVLDFIHLTDKRSMANAPRHCHGMEGKTCNHFFVAVDKGSHHLCLGCRGKQCSLDLKCEHCHDCLHAV